MNCKIYLEIISIIWYNIYSQGRDCPLSLVNIFAKANTSQEAPSSTSGSSSLNREIKKMIRGEKPTLIVKELLNFKSMNNKFNKKIRNRLNKWYSGYINEKIELECNKQEIKFLNVNPAYTSQICNSCNKLGKRNGEVFVCKNCGRKHADINAAVNILKRKDIKEIDLYTKKEKVKEMFEKVEVS